MQHRAGRPRGGGGRLEADHECITCLRQRSRRHRYPTEIHLRLVFRAPLAGLLVDDESHASRRCPDGVERVHTFGHRERADFERRIGGECGRRVGAGPPHFAVRNQATFDRAATREGLTVVDHDLEWRGVLHPGADGHDGRGARRRLHRHAPGRGCGHGHATLRAGERDSGQSNDRQREKTTHDADAIEVCGPRGARQAPLAADRYAAGAADVPLQRAPANHVTDQAHSQACFILPPCCLCWYWFRGWLPRYSCCGCCPVGRADRPSSRC